MATKKPTMDARKKALHEAVDAFLENRRESKRGGWADVQPGDILDLDFIIDELIELKFERDCDGDQTVLIPPTIDRNDTYDLPRYRTIPYEKSDRHPKGVTSEEALFISLHNLDLAMEEVSRYRRVVERERRDKK